jgi:hypothetical protein
MSLTKEGGLLILWVALSVAAASGCSFSTGESMKSFEISGVKLKIKEKYLLSENLYSVRQANGLDKANDIALSLKLSDLGLDRLSTEGVRSDLIVRLFEYEPISADGGYDKDAMAAWQGIGLYKDRILESDGDLFRVYSPNANKKMWHYFKVPPSNSNIKIGDWVARCRVSPAVEEDGERKNVRCMSSSVYKGVGIEVRFSGYYIGRLDEINGALSGFIKNELEEQ